MHYPFGKDGKFHFPPIKKNHIYEKHDGINVLAYRYQDVDGNFYLTYKLRLYAILRNSRWGLFMEMWNELIKKYPVITQLVSENNCLSLEMYGMRNAHLMLYDVELGWQPCLVFVKMQVLCLCLI